MATPTVLIVDDDDSIREITQLALEMVGGWTVVSANGGARALELANEHMPDAVLLDVMMPDMDGPTTFRHLQADEKTEGSRSCCSPPRCRWVTGRCGTTSTSSA